MSASHLVVGCYERFLFGFQLPQDPQETKALPTSFSYPAHQGPVRCVAAAGSWLVSGGADDQIHIYDLQRGRDCGFLMNPGEGAVPCLAFYTPPDAPQPTHLFSGSADGSVGIWQAGGDWDHLKQMRGHKGPVNGLALHPSGRLALSVAHDGSLRLWDLARGRCTYTARLDDEASAVAFTPSGEAYALVCGSTLTLNSTAGEAGGALATLAHGHRITALLEQQSEEVLLLGLEDGSLQVWDVRAPEPQFSLERSHATRIRGLAAVTPGGTPAAAAPLPHCLASASSDGVVRLWDSRMLASSGAARQLAQAETRSRITCLVAAAPGARRAATAAAAASKPAAGASGVAARAAASSKEAGGRGAKATGLATQAAPTGGQQRGQRQQQQQQPAGPQSGKAGKQAAAQSKQQAPPKQRASLQLPSQAGQTKHQAQPRSGRAAPPTAAAVHGAGSGPGKQKARTGGPAGGAGRAGGGSKGGDETLVPRVRTRIIKKRKKGAGQDGEGLDAEMDGEEALLLADL